MRRVRRSSSDEMGRQALACGTRNTCSLCVCVVFIFGLLPVEVATGSDPGIIVTGARHLTSGLPATLQLTGTGGIIGSTGEWYLLVANSVVGTGTLTWEPGDGGTSRASLEIPPFDVRRRTNARLVIRPSSGSKQGESVISLLVYQPVALPLPPAPEKVVALKADRTVREFLRLLGYAPDVSGSVDDLDPGRGILVAALPEGKRGERLGNSVSAWVRRGGRALLLDETGLEVLVDFSEGLTRKPNESGAGWDEIELTAPDTFPWSGIEPVDLTGWKDDGIVAVGGIRWSGFGEKPTVLATAVLKEERKDREQETDPAVVLVEFRWGEGKCLLSRLGLTGKIERDPFVPELARRLIARTAGEDHARKE